MCPSLERPTPSNSRALSQRSCRHPSRDSAPQRAAASSQQVEHPQPRCGPPALLRGASSAPPSLSLRLGVCRNAKDSIQTSVLLVGLPPFLLFTLSGQGWGGYNYVFLDTLARSRTIIITVGSCHARRWQTNSRARSSQRPASQPSCCCAPETMHILRPNRARSSA